MTMRGTVAWERSRVSWRESASWWGRRAAELADGALIRFAQELLDVLFVDVLALVAALSQEDRNTILGDFDAGKIYILIDLNIRS